ncbi:hypothetical protein MANES_15G166300v8 [Manihot esculenta]|nr:hypothetical protein MANES_15G166300v8 [Manihot esculenta]
MDKQILDLTSSSTAHQSQLSSSPKQTTTTTTTTRDFIDLMNPPQDNNQDHHQHQSHYNSNGSSIIGSAGDNEIKKEEIIPSYDFQPIRSIASSLNSSIAGLGAPTTASKNYGSLDSIEPARAIVEKDQNASHVAILSEVDETMKRHAENLVHILEGVSAQLIQLETRTRHLENSVDDLKLSVGNNHGSTDGKMRHLENILREVQSGVYLLKEKQEVVEAQLQIAKLQVSKGDQQQSEIQNSVHMDTVQQAASAPPQSHQQLQQVASAPPQSHQHLQQAASAPPQSHQQLPPVSFPQSIPPVPPAAVPPVPISQQNLPPPTPLPNQLSQSQIPPVHQREPYYSPPGQMQEPPNPQFQASPSQQQPHLSLTAPPHQSYQLASQAQYHQPPNLPQPEAQRSVSIGHHAEEVPYVPSQSYPPSLRQSSSHPASGAPSSPQFYGASHIFELPSTRPNSGFSAGYGPSSGPTEPYAYGKIPSQYGSNPPMKPQQLSSLAVSHSGGSGYPQLPTARILPQALPTASGVSGGSGSSGTGNRVPIDDVVDKVTSMGFPREHVRATVRKLTENGQSVDLNVVLDKLMNDGDVQPQRSWFGR